MPSQIRPRTARLLLALATALGGVATVQPCVGERTGYDLFLDRPFADAGAPALGASGLRTAGVLPGEGGHPLTTGGGDLRQNGPAPLPPRTLAHSRARAALLQFNAQAQLRRGERAGLEMHPAIPPPVAPL